MLITVNHKMDNKIKFKSTFSKTSFIVSLNKQHTIELVLLLQNYTITSLLHVTYFFTVFTDAIRDRPLQDPELCSAAFLSRFPRPRDH